MENMWWATPFPIIYAHPSLKILTQSTTEEGAKDIAAFVAIFFENFSQFKGRAFHMSGESYGVSIPAQAP